MASTLPKKRLAVGAIALFLLIISWLWWSHIMKMRLQAKIDELESRHEPVYVTDLDFPPVPDGQNAAFYYLSAAVAKSATIISPAESNLSYPGYPPYPPAWYQLEDQAYVANQKAFSIARQARNLDRADWGVQSIHFASANTTNLNAMRSLANELGDAALYAHMHHNDEQAIQYLFDVLHQADSVDQHGLLIDRLVAAGIQALAVDRIETIAVDLQIRGHSNSPDAVDRADVFQLIQQLLDEPIQSKKRSWTMARERIAAFSQLFYIRDRATVLRPLVNLWEIHTLDEWTLLSKAMDAPNWPMAQAILSGAQPYSRYVEIEFRVTSQRRLAAVSLALQLYRSDHGNYPSDLKSLVGEYLAAVPLDPFYAMPQPIGYLPPQNSGVIRPLLFIDPPRFPVDARRRPGRPRLPGIMRQRGNGWTWLRGGWLPARGDRARLSSMTLPSSVIQKLITL